MDTHVLPIDDLFPHDEHRTCWCQPVVEEVWPGQRVIIHRSADGRELLEDDAVTTPLVRH